MSRGKQVNWPTATTQAVKQPDITRTVAILGMGEIGKAIKKVYDLHAPGAKVLVRDVDVNEFIESAMYLHVCIPGSLPDFKDVVLKAVKDLGGEVCVIIHSTVQVGTTEELGKAHQLVCHSPVRGVHPELYEGVMTFKKFIGADFAGAGRLAQEELTRLGISTQLFYRSRTTELLKLLDTSYYGVCIAFHGYAKQLCDQEGLDFEHVMTAGNDSYNEGYWKLGIPQVIRPVLNAPTGPLGGHCVLGNAKLIKEHFGVDPMIDAILRWS